MEITPLTTEVILSIYNPKFDERLDGDDEYYLIGAGNINKALAQNLY